MSNTLGTEATAIGRSSSLAPRTFKLPVEGALRQALARIRSELAPTRRLSHGVYWDSGWVEEVAYSPDGRLLATTSGDHRIRVREAETGRCLNELVGHADIVLALAFSADAAQLMSVGSDATIRRWRLGDGACLQVHTLKPTAVEAAWLEPYGEHALVAFSDGVRLFSVSDGTCRAVMTGHAGRVWQVRFDLAAASALTAGEDGTARRYQLSNGQLLTTYAHGAPVRAVCGAPDGGPIIYTGGADRLIRCFDRESGQCVRTLSGHTEAVRRFENWRGELLSLGNDNALKFWTPDGVCRFTHAGPDYTSSRVAAVMRTGHAVVATFQHVFLVNIQTGDWDPIAETESRLTAMDLSEDESLLAIADCGGVVQLFDLTTRSIVRKIATAAGSLLNAVALSEDKRLLAMVGEHGCVQVFDLRAGTRRSYASSTTWPFAVKVRGGRLILGGRGQELLTEIDLSSGRTVCHHEGHQNSVLALALGGDGRWLASASADGQVFVWDRKRGSSKVTAIDPLPGFANDVAITRDGLLIASTCHDGGVRVYTRSGQHVRTYRHEYSAAHVAFSHDGRRLASTGADYRFCVWDLASGQGVLDLPGDLSARALAVHPAGDHIVTGSHFGVVRRWRPDRRELIQKHSGFGVPVSAIAYCPAGNFLGIGGSRRGARLLDLSTGRPLQEIEWARWAITTLLVSPSGRRVVMGGNGNRVLIWAADDGRAWRTPGDEDDDGIAVAMTRSTARVYVAATKGRIREYDTLTCHVLRTFQQPTRVTALCLNESETDLFAGGEDGMVRQWDLRDLPCVVEYRGEGGPVSALGLRTEAHIIVSGHADGTVCLFEQGRSEPIRSWKTRSSLNSLCLTDDSVVSGAESGEVFAWSTLDGRRLCAFVNAGHRRPVTGIVALPERNLLITGSLDQTVRFWKMSTGELRATFYNRQGGYLWLTPPDEEATSGWFFGDRESEALIDVIERDEGGGRPRALATGDAERLGWLAAYCDPRMVLARVNDWQAYERELSRRRQRQASAFVAPADHPAHLLLR